MLNLRVMVNNRIDTQEASRVLPSLSKENVDAAIRGLTQLLAKFFGLTDLTELEIRKIWFNAVRKPTQSLGSWNPKKRKLRVEITQSMATDAGEANQMVDTLFHEFGHAFHQFLLEKLKIKPSYKSTAYEAFAEWIALILDMLDTDIDSQDFKKELKKKIPKDHLLFLCMAGQPYPTYSQRNGDAAILHYIFVKYGLGKVLEVIEASPVYSTKKEHRKLFWYRLKKAFAPETPTPIWFTNALATRYEKFYDWIAEEFDLADKKQSTITQQAIKWYESK